MFLIFHRQTMKATLSKIFGKISKVLLVFLGFGFQFQSCIFGAMYGCPHADFSVKGTVTDEDGKGIPNIQVVVDGYQQWTDDLDSTLQLLEDVPGTGKTMLFRSFAKTVGGDFKRIQFTPDLLPSVAE